MNSPPLAPWKTFLLLMAMGSWGNTPSPPLDSEAPDPVGNEGELQLDVGDERATYLIQSAHLSDGALLLEGESVGGQPLFVLSAQLPREAFDGKNLDTRAVRSVSLEVRSATFQDVDPISLGSLTLLNITGSGPWQIDGELQLTTSLGDSYRGTLQTRLRS